MPQQVPGEGTGVLADDANRVWDLVQPFTDGMQVAQGHQFALVEDDDLLGDAFDFTQNMTADEHGSAQLPSSRITFMMVVLAKGSHP